MWWTGDWEIGVRFPGVTTESPNRPMTQSPKICTPLAVASATQPAEPLTSMRHQTRLSAAVGPSRMVTVSPGWIWRTTSSPGLPR